PAPRRRAAAAAPAPAAPAPPAGAFPGGARSLSWSAPVSCPPAYPWRAGKESCPPAKSPGGGVRPVDLARRVMYSLRNGILALSGDLMNRYLLSVAFLVFAGGRVGAGGDLVIAEKGKAHAAVVVEAKAGPWEKRAADDLARFIGLMTGAKPAIVNTLPADAPALVVGGAALAAEPGLRQALERVAKKEPVLRADAIVLRRQGNRVYLAGTNDDSHYYAAAELLRRWGCRWYLPTDFGACVPDQQTLTLDKLDHAYAPPFEVRGYWIAWNG